MSSPNRSRKFERASYLLASLVVTGALIETVSFWVGIRRARRLAAAGRRFERRLHENRAATVLVLGDSTGVGVGAELPQQSIAGLLAADFPDADIVNVSESGARVAGTLAQAHACIAAGLRFDVALLHVGANDIVADTPLDKLASDCDTLLSTLGTLALRTVWLGPPDIGLAPLFPKPYAWIMSARSRAAARVFSDAAARHNMAFVDFSAPAHAVHFSRRRREHFAVDGFHPNSASYRYGYKNARHILGNLKMPKA